MNKEAINIYPLTIISDRYGGVYSGARFTAWNEYDSDVPYEASANDMMCGEFWDKTKKKVGKGNTPNEALEDLYSKLQNK